MKLLICLMFLSGSIFYDAHAGKIIVHGNAKHFTGDTLLFSYEPYQLLQKQRKIKIPVKNGLFSFTLQSDVAVRGFFSFGTVPATYHVDLTFPDGRDSSYEATSNDPRLVLLYLQPGAPLTMTLDINNIEQTLRFTGAGANDNIFVNKEDWILNKYQERVFRNFHEPVYFPPDTFTEINKKRFDRKLRFLDSMSRVYTLSPAVKDVYYWKFYSEWVTARLYYPKTHELYTSETLHLPEGYFDFVNNVKTAEVGSSKGVGYWYFLDAVMRKKYEMQKDSTLSFEAFIKQNMTGRACYEYLAYTLNKDMKREVLDMFEKNCPYPDIAAIVKERFGHMKTMLPGSPAPAVTLLAADAKTFSFADYKGKYVYVDLWATWCGPCIKEIPSLLKLEAEYHEKDITFLSVSFDQDADAQKWQDYIRNNTMGKIQLRADAKSHRLLTDSWNISMIPRFVILDKEGNIVDANAPFPSSKEIRPALNKLLR